MKNLTRFIVAGVLAAAGITSAPAQSGIAPRSETVKFADLDTATERGAAVLFARLKVAAGRVCQDLESDRSLALRAAHEVCVRTAVAGALTRANRPALTAYAVSRGFVAADGVITVARNR